MKSENLPDRKLKRVKMRNPKGGKSMRFFPEMKPADFPQNLAGCEYGNNFAKENTGKCF